jgi:hypothetical protein
MAYTASPGNIMLGLGIYIARSSGPSVSDPAALFTNRWTVVVQFGPWIWRKMF